MIVAILSAIALIAGALALHAAAPHQAILAPPVPARALRLGGGAALLTALLLLLCLMGPATAVFTWLTGAMLIWTIVPVVVRWWQFRKENQA